MPSKNKSVTSFGENLIVNVKNKNCRVDPLDDNTEEFLPS